MDLERKYQFHYQVGCKYFESSNYIKAQDHWELAYKIKPDGYEVSFALSSYWVVHRDYQKALSFLQRWLDQGVEDPQLYYELGRISFWSLELEKARDYFQKSHELGMLQGAKQHKDDQIGNLSSYLTFLVTSKHLANFQELNTLLGVDLLKEPITEVPLLLKLCGEEKLDSYSHSIAAVALAAERMKQYELSIRLLTFALKVYDRIDVLNNLAILLYHLQRDKESLGYAEQMAKAMEGRRGEEDLDIISNASHVFLRNERFSEAWKLYEWRQDITKKEVEALFSTLPEWQGERGKKVHLLCLTEQGLGDNLMFLRFLLDVQERFGLEISFVCPRVQYHLFKHNLPAVACYPYHPKMQTDEILQKATHRISLGSLPGILQTTRETIPFAKGPYIQASPTLLRKMQEKFPPTSRLRIGFVFRCSPHSPESYLYRSIPAQYFEKLSELSGIELYSFQVGAAERPIRHLGKKPHVHLLGRFLKDFDDTAAACSYMDLLIAPDTSMVHMAGSLGVPFWVLIPYQKDWRWFKEQETTSWYSSGRLFFQKEPWDWSSPFQEVLQRVAIAAECKQKGDEEAVQRALLFKRKDQHQVKSASSCLV